MQIVCTSCGTPNHLPAGGENEPAVCGTCKAQLQPEKPLVLGDANFHAFLAGTELPVVVDFWAPWCGSCRVTGPQFDEAAKTMRHVVFATLNVEENPVVSEASALRGVPTLILYQNGQELYRFSGAMRASGIEAWVESGLPKG